MENFMTSFESRKEKYLEHYGVPGMRWGVINEDEPVGRQPGAPQQISDPRMSYSPADQEAMGVSARQVQASNEELVKQRRKEIRRKIVGGVAVGAILTALAVGGIKAYGKKQTGQNQTLGESIGIIGNKITNFSKGTVSGIKEGFNADLGELKKQNEARKRAQRIKREQMFKDTAAGLSNRFGEWVAEKQVRTENLFNKYIRRNK